MYILYIYTPTCNPNKCPPKKSVEERFVHPLPLGSLGIHSQLILMDAHGHPTTIGLSDSLGIEITEKHRTFMEIAFVLKQSSFIL